MKKEIICKITIGLALAMLIVIFSTVPAQAADSNFEAAHISSYEFIPILSDTALTANSTNSSFFVERDHEGYAYKVGDIVEVKINRGYYTVKCQITDRKDGGFLNGYMYYVTPVEDLNILQGLFFGPGWVHESDIQITNPQPYINKALEYLVRLLPFI